MGTPYNFASTCTTTFDLFTHTPPKIKPNGTRCYLVSRPSKAKHLLMNLSLLSRPLLLYLPLPFKNYHKRFPVLLPLQSTDRRHSSPATHPLLKYPARDRQVSLKVSLLTFPPVPLLSSPFLKAWLMEATS